MHSLRILHVLRAPVGGLFRHVVDLVQGQVARGHRVGIVADSLTGDARTNDTLARLAPSLALGLSRLPIKRPFGLHDIAVGWHITQIVRRLEPDVVHGHGSKGGAFARLAIAKKPAIRAYTPHGGSLLIDASTPAGKLFHTLERAMTARGQLYLFESAYSAAMFRDKVGEPSGLTRIVHNGVAGSEFAPVPLAPDATDIIFLGELRAVKGVDVLIDAIALLHANGRRVTATLVGAGPSELELRARVAALGLTDAIRFRGPMAAREAMTLGRVMTIPSRAESLPYVVLEAAAAAKPLLTTNVGGIPEIFGPQSNLLLPAGDAAALATAIAGALDQPQAMDAAAEPLRERIARFFSVDTMVDGVLSGYEAAIERVPALSQALLSLT